jgi:hypothetical protein
VLREGIHKEKKRKASLWAEGRWDEVNIHRIKHWLLKEGPHRVGGQR